MYNNLPFISLYSRDPTYTVDKNLSTPLMWAAGGGHVAILKQLLSRSKGLRQRINSSDKKGRTALMQAARQGQLGSVKTLLLHGADVGVRTADGSSVLDWAAAGGRVSLIAFLLGAHTDTGKHHMQVQEEEEEGQEEGMPLAERRRMWAAAAGGVLEGLRTRPTNAFGCGAEHWAAASGALKALQWMHAPERGGAFGFDLQRVNNAMHGLVNAAAYKGHRRLVEWLLSPLPEGPNLGWQLHVRDHQGRTLPELIRSAGHLELADWLQARAVASDGGGNPLDDGGVSK